MISMVIVELLGAFALTFVAAASRINNDNDFFAIALTYFMIISSLTFAFRKVSGSHFNPALTVSLIVTKQVSINKAILYIIGQIAGSILGGLAIVAITNTSEDQIYKYYGEPMLHADEQSLGAFAEFVSIFILVYVYASILGDIRTPSHIYGFAVGGVYFAMVISMGFLSGGCLNFVTVLGPALFSGNLRDLLYYLISQMLGGIIGGVFYTIFFKEQSADQDFDESIQDKAMSSKLNRGVKIAS